MSPGPNYEGQEREFDEDPSADRPRISRAVIRQFREQIHALGALWIIIGSLALGLAAVALSGNKDVEARIAGEYEVLVIILAVSGSLWLVLGIATLFKQMWAVYTALVLSYVSVVSHLLNLNVCALIIVILVILQAHRVIIWAGQMRAAGVPLTTRPT